MLQTMLSFLSKLKITFTAAMTVGLGFSVNLASQLTHVGIKLILNSVLSTSTLKSVSSEITHIAFENSLLIIGGFSRYWQFFFAKGIHPYFFSIHVSFRNSMPLLLTFFKHRRQGVFKFYIASSTRSSRLI